MTQHDDVVYLQHMLQYAVEAYELGSGRDAAELEGDRLRYLSVARLLEIVGEAASRVPEDLRATLPSVRWRSVVGLRNVLIHAYDRVDAKQIAAIIARDLPGLIRTLEDALGAD